MQTEFELRKKRTFSEKISDTFKYLRYHFKPLFKAILFICAPIGILAGLLIGSFYANMFSNIGNMQYSNDPFAMLSSGFVELIGGFIILAIAMFILFALIAEYMKLSAKKDRDEIEFKDITSAIRENLGKYIGASFIIYGLMFGGIVILAIIPILGIIAAMVLGAYFGISTSLYSYVIANEKTTAWESLKRSIAIIKGKWWESFGYYFVMNMIQSAISYAFILPMYGVMMFLIFSNAGSNPDALAEQMGTFMSIFAVVMFFISMFLYSIMGISWGINYYSLVEEKEEVGLQEKLSSMIDEIKKSEEEHL
jgi:MFS family permease